MYQGQVGLTRAVTAWHGPGGESGLQGWTEVSVDSAGVMLIHVYRWSPQGTIKNDSPENMYQ